MNKPKQINPRKKGGSVLITVSLLFLFVASMVIDPYAGFIFLILAGIFSLSTVIFYKMWTRYIAIIILLIIIILMVDKFPQARDQYQAYRNKSLNNNTK